MFRGKKTKLRAYRNDEVERVWNLLENSDVRETLWMGTLFPISLESERDFINSAMKNSGELYNFAIESLENVEYIGGCGINALDRKNSVATVGIWLGEEFQGKGYGSDALRVLCRFIFDELNVNKVRLNYFDFNEAGKRCYESVGFVKEGRNRREIFRYGKYYDTINMGLFREELK